MGDIWNEIWRSLLLIVIGMLLLKISGRKSISQMTIPTTIIMISIGTVIVQPIANKHIVLTITAAVVFILVLLVVEFMQLKWNAFEMVMKGPAIVVIRDGQLHIQNLKKLRMTVDTLEMQLRQQGIANIGDVKTATIESNGGLGYELFDWAKPITHAQMETLLANYLGRSPITKEIKAGKENSGKPSLFEEVKTGHHGTDNKHLE
ncbi:DUF421 domain-containing protein [Shouchella clausii]|uniref:DUF421 domain-containing protein n=1 Tax=Shouchella tritolerans TaxID=2979466 RepID=UPI000786BCDC|nr:DUF421 domain-containing protein [Shouchella tritolerans]GIN13455.1 DUF421 domain-containing protein [Shouchella clausii]